MSNRRYPPDITPLRGDPPPPLPVDDQLEKLLLAALLTDNKRLADVGYLKPEHFGFEQHQRLFALIRDVIKEGLPATPKTLTRLNGEAPYVTQLADAALTTTPLAVSHWSGQLVTLHYQRQALALGCDLSRIFTEAPGEHSYIPRLEAVFGEFAQMRKMWREEVPETGERPVFALAGLGGWMSRDMEAPDFLLGEIFSTTSRVMLYAKTGLGKTSISLAAAIAIAGGPGRFLHWEIPRAARVLYIDGEMSLRLMKSRILDAVRRHGAAPQTLFVLSREDFPDMQPLNTEKGQRFIDRVIEELGGLDAIFFDNIQALLVGNHRDPDAWAAVLPWCRELTRRRIGQFWIHHTGWDDSHSYGDSTREWQLDTVIKLSPPEVAEDAPPPEASIIFKMDFDKARDRTPQNYRDFQSVTITLDEDEWSLLQNSQKASKGRGRPNRLEEIALRALDDALAISGQLNAHPKIPSGQRSVPRELWLKYFKQQYVGDGDEKAVTNAFRRQAVRLQMDNRVAAVDGIIWRIF